MFIAARILAVSFLAVLVSAFPASVVERAPELGELTDAEALALVGRATKAPVYSKCTTPNTVAITFDDGPYNWTTDLVALLKQYNAKATFFVNGDNWGCIYAPENVQRLKTAFNAGHQIASHTWHHYNWTTLTNTQLKTEMTKTDTAMKKILGVKAAFVRPPFGAYNDNSRVVAASNGQSIVVWDFDSGDSVGDTVAQSEALYAKIAKAHPSTILTLNHETHETTVKQVIPYALKTLAAKKYKFVTVAECLGNKAPYLIKQTPAKRDATWTC